MINQIVKFDVKPEQAAAFKAALIADSKGAGQEAGCLELKLFVDNTNPNIFFAYERFQNEAAVSYHNQQPYTQLVAKQIGSALNSPAQALKLGETTPAPLYEANPKKPHSQAQPFIIFFIFKIKDGYREKLLQQFEKHIECTRREEKVNILFDLYTIDGQNDTLAVYEHWRKELDVWDIHFKQPYALETGKMIHEAVVGEMEQYIRVLQRSA